MKNLRKVLALVLVVASLMGMAVMANADFTDADKISGSNKQAVEVLSALDIIGGYKDGSYQPKKVVTRAEMAKMISVILNSGKDINDLYKASCTFADSKNHWAAGYIGYCATMGIISGKSETVFAPDATVTGVEAAKMMLCALEFEAEAEGFTGPSWKGNVLNHVDRLDLFDRISVNPDDGMTRENAAQLLWNGMQKKVVSYSGGSSITVGGVTFVSGGVRDDVNGQVLVEREFDITVSRARDEWYRPYTLIQIAGEDDIISYDIPDIVSNKPVKTSEIYKIVNIKGADMAKNGVTVNVHAGGYDITNANCAPYFWNIVGGAANATSWNGITGIAQLSSKNAGMTASSTSSIGTNADTIEIYWDADEKVLDIIVMWTGAAKIAEVTTNSTAKTTTIKTVASGFGYGNYLDKTYTVKTAETDITKDNEGDVVIVSGARVGGNTGDYEIAIMYLPTVVTGTSEGTVISSANKTTSLYMEGKTYTCDGNIDASKSGAFTVGEEFNVYLDKAGFAHAYQSVVETADAKYAYVLAVDTEKASFAETTNLAQVLFADGVVEVIETKTLATVGELCSYTVDSKNVYTLTTADATTEAVAITKGQAIIGNYFANKNTVFVVETTVNGKAQYDVYTGINNVPSLKATNILVVEDAETADLLDIVYCLTSELEGSNATTDLEISMLYVPSDLSKYTKVANGVEYSYYSAKAWINGAATTVKVSPEVFNALKATKNTVAALELIKGYSLDENGVVDTITAATGLTAITAGTANWKDGIITINGVKTYIEEGTPVYYYEQNSSAFEKHTVEELNDSAKETILGGWYLADSNGNIVAIYGTGKIS